MTLKPTPSSQPFVTPDAGQRLRRAKRREVTAEIKAKYKKLFTAAATKPERAALKAQMQTEIAAQSQTLAPDPNHASPHNLY